MILVEPTRHAQTLLDDWVFQRMGLGLVQTWRDGSAIFVECDVCHGPAVIVLGYVGHVASRPRIQCLRHGPLAHFHGRPLTDAEITLLYQFERAETRFHPVAPTPAYTVSASL